MAAEEASARVNRRRFLWAAAFAVMAAVLAVVAGWVRHLRRSSTRNILRRRLSYLTFTDEVLDAFLRDHLAEGRAPTDVRNDVHLLFLLSTDFFQNGADERRPLTYTSYFHAYASPCANPFARSAS